MNLSKLQETLREAVVANARNPEIQRPNSKAIVAPKSNSAMSLSVAFRLAKRIKQQTGENESACHRRTLKNRHRKNRSRQARRSRGRRPCLNVFFIAPDFF